MRETTPIGDAANAWDRRKPDVVIFGIVPWSRRWQRPHHLAAELVRRGHRVVYVTPHLLTGRADWREIPDVARPDGVVLAQLGAEVLDSVHRSASWSYEDLAQAHHQFWEMWRELRLRCPILLVQTPHWWPLIQWIRERSEFPLVYDCLDEHTGWDPEVAERARTWEGELARQADLVLASARPLYERLREQNGDAVLIPNACDVGRFEPCARPSGVLRSVLDGPIVGYYGAVAPAWVDASLLACIAELCPAWNVVVIGPCDEVSAETLDACPNVLRLDEVPYADLPRYCADFDVAVIPFLVNELTYATDPVKLYEYLAAGKPVVTTPMPEVYPLQGLLTVADDAGSFVEAIERYLLAPGDATARQAVARRTSWSTRVDGFYHRMLACLPPLTVEIVPGPGDAGLTRASVERDPSYQATVTVVEGVERARTEAARQGSTGYLLVLPAGVELPPGGLLAFVGALARRPEVDVVIGEIAESATEQSLRELAWSRFGTTHDTGDAATVEAPLVLRRSLKEPAREVGGERVVRCPELLVRRPPAGRGEEVDSVVGRALERRAVMG